MRKPRALREGDRIALVAPASPFARDDFDAGVAELRAAGLRARVRRQRLRPPIATSPARRRRAPPPSATPGSIRRWRRIIAVRGGYGSVQMLPLLDARDFAGVAKAFIGYSDNTSLLTWLNQACGVVAFHGPMLEGRLARGEAGYDRDTFRRCLCRAEPTGAIAHPLLETLRPGEAAGVLVGGTLTQLVASLGTPYAFDAAGRGGAVPRGRRRTAVPPRPDADAAAPGGMFERAAAIVFGEMPGCDEPGGQPAARDVIVDLFEGFPGPVLFGLPSGHTDGPTLTLPFGVRARVVAAAHPRLIVEEAAVVDSTE